MDIKHTRYAALERIYRAEGGYSNNPNDSGGETNYGITKAVALSHGYEGEMIVMPQAVAGIIYNTMYLNRINFDALAGIAPLVALRLSDIAVNMGIGRAGKFLQRALNVMNNKETYFNDVIVDGVIGDQSINALTMYISKRGSIGAKVIAKMIADQQSIKYIELAEARKKDEEFMYGWQIRTMMEGF